MLKNKNILRTLNVILFSFVMASGLHAKDLKSITINEIGEHDVPWWSLIINTHAKEQGLQLDRRRFFYYEFAVDKTTFDEIIDFINNRELFGERYLFRMPDEDRTGPYGAVELFIENKRKKYYLYLVTRKASSMFFYGLLEIIRKKGNYNELAAKIEDGIGHFGFDRYNKDLWSEI